MERVQGTDGLEGRDSMAAVARAGGLLVPAHQRRATGGSNWWWYTTLPAGHCDPALQLEADRLSDAAPSCLAPFAAGAEAVRGTIDERSGRRAAHAVGERKGKLDARSSEETGRQLSSANCGRGARPYNIQLASSHPELFGLDLCIHFCSSPSFSSLPLASTV